MRTNKIVTNKIVLPSGFEVNISFGHIKDLPKKDKGEPLNPQQEVKIVNPEAFEEGEG